MKMYFVMMKTQQVQTKESLTIRFAKAADIEGRGKRSGIRDLYNASRRYERAQGRSPLSPPEYKTWMRMIDKQNSVDQCRYQFLIAEDKKGNIVGMSLATHSPRNIYTMWNKLVISPKYQGQGLGQTFFEAVKKKAVNLNKKSIRVKAESGKIKASSYYRKLGFYPYDAYVSQSGIKINRLSKRLR